jgi:hypothetical protein
MRPERLARQLRGQTVRSLQPQEGIMSNVDAYHEWLYSQTDPIDWACELSKMLMDTMLTIIGARYYNPAAFPGYGLELTTTSFGRQIVGRLMDAGWTPPPTTPTDPRMILSRCSHPRSTK